MTQEIITEYFTRYGSIAVFVIVLLEYMNLPGDWKPGFGHLHRGGQNKKGEKWIKVF